MQLVHICAIISIVNYALPDARYPGVIERKFIMAYTNQTLKKLADLYKAYIALLETGKQARVHVSKGNRKIGRVLNVSTVPVMDCQNCKECSRLCYAINSYIRYTNTCVPAWTENSFLARNNRDLYFAEIEKACAKRRTNKYFRWHVAGEIMDINYLERMIDIARKFPEFKFWTYTKMYLLVNMYVKAHGNDRKIAIPENLVIMFSEWRGMEMINPYGFPEFRVVFKNDEYKPDPKTNWYCPGNCDICKAVNRGCVAGETTYCNEH